MGEGSIKEQLPNYFPSHSVKMAYRKDHTKRFATRAKPYLPSPNRVHQDNQRSFQVIYGKSIHDCHLEDCLCKQRGNRGIPPEIAETLFEHDGCSSAHHKKCQILHGYDNVIIPIN